MLEFFLLGQIPGTHLQISFIGWLLIAALCVFRISRALYQRYYNVHKVYRMHSRDLRTSYFEVDYI